jgi:HAD superfamily phosphoserine phosphatase-like hydrolase
MYLMSCFIYTLNCYDKTCFFDIDQTIYDGYSTFDLCIFLSKNGVGENIEKKAEKLGKLYFSGKISYTEATRRIIELQAEALTGLQINEVVNLQDKFITKSNRLFPWVKELFSLLEKNGFVIYLISAAASPSAEAVARSLKTDKFFASKLEIKNKKYTGKVLKILNDHEKQHVISNVLAEIDGDGLKIGLGTVPVISRCLNLWTKHLS